MLFIVYHVVNLRNAKGYVGFTGRPVEARWKAHLSSARQKSPFRFHSAIRKYGPDAWRIEILFSSTEEMEARRIEEREILSRDYSNRKKGYNAKPGGCGGWIVKPENYDKWYAKKKAQSQGESNANALITSNDRLIELGLEFIEKNGFIPGSKRLRAFGEERGVKVPKIFTAYRFGGFSGLVEILEKKSGLIYDRYYRDKTQKKMLSENIRGRHWYHNDDLKKNRQLRQENLSLGWELGRKKYD